MTNNSEINGSFMTWDKTKLGKPFYYFFIYVPKYRTESEFFSSQTLKIQRDIWLFKDGIQQNNFIELMVQKIKESFENPHLLTLVCVPASTNFSNINRYKNFSLYLCNILNITNGYDYIKINKESEPKHLTGESSFAEYWVDPNFFSGKKVLLFDDVVTKGNSMRNFISILKSVGADVICCMSIGRTYFKPLDGEDPVHPAIGTKIRSGNYIQNTQVIESLKPNTVYSPKSTSSLFADNFVNTQRSPFELSFVKSTEIIKTGKLIKFGRFKGKPIEWEILKVYDNSSLLITRFGIECLAYNNKMENTTWEECSLRRWLNVNFFNSSFTEIEKRYILRHTVPAEVIPNHELYPGNDTFDNVHILSVNEYNEYYGKKKQWRCLLLENKQDRQCWLRNYGKDRTRASFVGRSGRLHEGGSYITSQRNTVRPIILLSH